VIILKDTVRVAAIQLWIKSELKSGREGNIKRAIVLMEEAVTLEADFICLPELFIGAGFSEPIPGPTTDILSDFARDNKVYLTGGLFENAGDIKYNSTPVFDRNGQIIFTHRKVNLFPWEPTFRKSTPGDLIKVLDLDFGKAGVLLCQDLAIPETPRILALKGAEILFVPSRMPAQFLASWKRICRVRALENNVFVCSAGMAKQKWVGTLIVSPRFENDVVVECGPDQQVITAELDLGWLRETRKDSPLYHVTTWKEIAEVFPKMKTHSFILDRRPDLYLKEFQEIGEKK
jgi:predicted amidohydrolase